jgi:hypothetical protein
MLVVVMNDIILDNFGIIFIGVIKNIFEQIRISNLKIIKIR